MIVKPKTVLIVHNFFLFVPFDINNSFGFFLCLRLKILSFFFAKEPINVLISLSSCSIIQFSSFSFVLIFFFFFFILLLDSLFCFLLFFVCLFVHMKLSNDSINCPRVKGQIFARYPGILAFFLFSLGSPKGPTICAFSVWHNPMLNYYCSRFPDDRRGSRH